MLHSGFKTLHPLSSQPRVTMRQRLQDHALTVLRAYVGANAVWSWYYGTNDPHAGLFAIGRYADGATLIGFMGIIGALIILDVFINDWTPEQATVAGRRFRIAWRKAFEYRHLMFIFLAFCYGAQPFVAKMAGRTVSLVGFFYLHAAFSIAVAFLDAKLRSRGPGWQRACS